MAADSYRKDKDHGSRFGSVERNQRGKNEARRLRAVGRIPAVVYGGKDGGKAIAVDPKVLARILRTEQGANTLIALNLPGGGDARVLVREYQLDPITHELLHADFYRVAMDKLSASGDRRRAREPKGEAAGQRARHRASADRNQCLGRYSQQHRVDVASSWSVRTSA
jgi:ribosomal protein L25 (general stress protein Ctc)